jgi:hypothetical protein
MPFIKPAKPHSAVAKPNDCKSMKVERGMKLRAKKPKGKKK